MLARVVYEEGILLDKYGNIFKEIIDMPFEEIMIIFLLKDWE